MSLTNLYLIIDSVFTDDRCDILIDSIQRIAIKTTTRELLVEEAPEEFQIMAYDQEGNVFSSLGGLKFHWSIHPDDENRMQKFAPESIITFVKFADSNYEADDVIKVIKLKLVKFHYIQNEYYFTIN